MTLNHGRVEVTVEAFHSRVTLGVQDGVAEVCLTRPQQHNGLDWSMIEGLLSAQRRLVGLTREGGGDIGAVVLSGEGESFCAGLDMKSIMSEPQRMPSLLEADETGVNPVQRLALGWRETGVPVIAALQGHVYGGGLQIALGADIRVVSPDARLALLEIAWGLVPDMGISVTASRMRDDVLLELTWTGREVAGQEAQTLGLATRLAEDPRGTALEMASTMVSRSPKAVAAARELFSRAPTLSRRERLALEARLQRGLIEDMGPL
ncbi:crotonase/enoyl-CoA hydratase family protein [Halomonas elongata]|uniref:crotonase/enoyl-CoA hydratase family protein n=1 Tax=Halomonas elongata TaxID=2746 RepID=UPI0038D41C4A